MEYGARQAPAGAADPPPAPSYARGDLVRYHSGPPFFRVQEGIVVAVLEGGRPVVGWLSGVSGPLEPDAPGLERLELGG